MSEDLAGIIEELIKSGKGDAVRLQNILTAIKNAEPVSFEDHQYIEDLTQSLPNQVSSDTTDLTENATDTTSSSPEISQTPEPVKKSSTRKYVSIGIIAAIIIVAYVGLDIYAVNNLQFRP